MRTTRKSESEIRQGEIRARAHAKSDKASEIRQGEIRQGEIRQGEIRRATSTELTRARALPHGNQSTSTRELRQGKRNQTRRNQTRRNQTRRNQKSNKHGTYQRRGFSVARKGRGARLLGDGLAARGLSRIGDGGNALGFCCPPLWWGSPSGAHSRGLFGPWHLAFRFSVALSLLRCRFIGNHPFYPTKKGGSDSELLKPKPKNPKPAIQKKGYYAYVGMGSSPISSALSGSNLTLVLASPIASVLCAIGFVYDFIIFSAARRARRRAFTAVNLPANLRAD